ncbi:hypothetical protein, partial [Spongiibacter tropicus]|uniref:hypothetical protein n=1 Tax=Spongiibacter tropicus TaxID=454602 RepID=UPI0035BE79FC
YKLQATSYKLQATSYKLQATLIGLRRFEKFPGYRNFYEAAVGVPFQGTNRAKHGIGRRAIRHFRARQLSKEWPPFGRLAALGSHLKWCSYNNDSFGGFVGGSACLSEPSQHATDHRTINTGN